MRVAFLRNAVAPPPPLVLSVSVRGPSMVQRSPVAHSAGESNEDTIRDPQAGGIRMIHAL